MTKCYSVQLEKFSLIKLFSEIFSRVSTFYYVWNWSKIKKFSVVVGGGGWVGVLKATLVFICGPNLKTRTLI